MIGVTIQGRFGNQFFQYFFVKALAEKLNTSFFLNESLEKFQPSDYFILKDYNSSKNRLNKLFFKFCNKKIFSKISNVEIGEYNNVYAELNYFKNNQSYGGYFQSESFFATLKEPIAEYITLKPSIYKSFAEKYGQIFNERKTVAVHVRRGDYLNLNDWWEKNLGSNNLTLPDEYYLKCLGLIENLETYNLIFISDDIDYAKNKFSHLENSLFLNDSLINDFQILMNADICILSNSSFSWWGAYLNSKSDKQIYCPKYWLGFKIKKEYPNRIIPNGWLQIDTNPTR